MSWIQIVWISFLGYCKRLELHYMTRSIWTPERYTHMHPQFPVQQQQH